MRGAAASAPAGERRVLALLAAPGTTTRAVALLGLLGEHADIVSWHRRGDVEPHAVVATSIASLSVLRSTPPVPTAVWVQHHEQIDEATAAGVTLLLTSQPELVARGAVLVPPVGIDVGRWPAVAPLVRARWRERMGLPASYVVRVEGGVEPEGGERALMVASAAVVSGPATLLALALGTPVVTSVDTARRLGLRPGRDAEVQGNADAALKVAEAIAADAPRAAALSRRARRCAEHHLDLRRPARIVAERLGLVGSSLGPEHLVERRLRELGLPVSSPTWRRVDAALAGLGVDRQGSLT